MEIIEKVARAICRVIVVRGLKSDWTAPSGGHPEATIMRFVERGWKSHVDAATAALNVIIDNDQFINEERPVLDDKWFQGADLYHGDKLIRKGYQP